MEEELDIEAVFKFKVEELKQALAKRGLPKSGSKTELQERLLQSVTNKAYINNDYGGTSANDSIGENEEYKELTEDHSDNLDDCLDKSDALEEDSTDKHDSSELSLNNSETIDNLEKVKDLDDEIIDTVTTPNDDVSATDENPDDVIDVHVKVDKIDKVDKNELPFKNEDTSEESSIENTSKPKFSKVKIATISMTNCEKKENRSKRFGEATSEAEKKKARLGRFSSVGLGKGEPVTEEDVEKIKKRAERFGVVSTILTTPDSSKDRLKLRQERFADTSLKKRQERFGIVQKQSLNLDSDMNARKQNRLAKFGGL